MANYTNPVLTGSWSGGGFNNDPFFNAGPNDAFVTTSEPGFNGGGGGGVWLGAGDYYDPTSNPTGRSGLGYSNWANFFAPNALQPFMKVTKGTEGFNTSTPSSLTDYASPFVHQYQVDNALKYKFDPQKYAYAGPSAFDYWHAGVTNGGILDRDPVEWAIEAQKNGRGWEDAIGEMLIPAMFGIAAGGLGGLWGSGAGASASAGDLIAGALADGGGASWMSGYGGLLGEGAAGGSSMFGDLGNLFGGDFTPFDWSSITPESLGNGVDLTSSIDWSNFANDPTSWGVDLSGFTGNIPSGSESFFGNLYNQAIENPLGTANQVLKGLQSTGLLGSGAQMLGGYLSGRQAQQGARTTADAQLEAARIAADAAKFRPVGVTTRFGKSDFVKDAQGNIVGAGYNLTPDVKALQDQLMGSTGGFLNQFTGSQQATAPMSQAAQSMFGLGNQYLATTPQAQAAKYMADQQALLEPARATDLANLNARLQAQGRTGLSVGGNAGMLPSNPELQAYYNSLRQQDLGLAAQATQGGMDYAKFGATMSGLGGDMLKGMYGTQQAAFAPYQTALGGAQTIEGLGQNALDLGVNIGKTTSNAQAGQLLGQGMANAAQTMQQANAYSPWGTALMGAGNMLNQYNQPGTTYDPGKYRLVPLG